MPKRNSTATTLRWILLLPTVLIAFFICVAAAIGIYEIAESFCPEEFITSAGCFAGYMRTTKEAILLITPPVAAGFMILCATTMSPSYKPETAMLTFFLGSVFALYEAAETGYWLSFVLTEAVAIAVTYWLVRKHRARDRQPKT